MATMRKLTAEEVATMVQTVVDMLPLSAFKTLVSTSLDACPR